MSNPLSNIGLQGAGNDPFGNQPNMVTPNVGPRMQGIQAQHPRTTPPLVGLEEERNLTKIFYFYLFCIRLLRHYRIIKCDLHNWMCVCVVCMLYLFYDCRIIIRIEIELQSVILF